MNRQVRRAARHGIALAAALLVLLATTGCSPKPHGTHDLDEINEIARRSGIFYDTSIGIGVTGYPFEYDYETEVVLSAGIDTPEKETAAVDYLLRLAWAETNQDPTPKQRGGSGGIRAFRPDGSEVDVYAIVNQLMGGDRCPRCEGLTDRMAHLYGRWPGPVPEVPDVLAHLADTRCDTKTPGPHGTYTCGQVAQIASEILGRYISYIAEPLDGKPRSSDGVVRIRDMVAGDPTKTDLVVNTWWVDPENLDYLLRAAWAETSVEPTGQVIVFGASHESVFPCGGGAPVGRVGVAVDHECLEQLYGPWPGPLPDPPPPSPTVSPAPSPTSSG